MVYGWTFCSFNIFWWSKVTIIKSKIFHFSNILCLTFSSIKKSVSKPFTSEFKFYLKLAVTFNVRQKLSCFQTRWAHFSCPLLMPVKEKTTPPQLTASWLFFPIPWVFLSNLQLFQRLRLLSIHICYPKFPGFCSRLLCYWKTWLINYLITVSLKVKANHCIQNAEVGVGDLALA